MAREWEVSPREMFDERAVDLGYYRRHNRRTEALNERKFRPEQFKEHDLRRADSRRFMQDDGYGDLDEVRRVKDSFEGLVD